MNAREEWPTRPRSSNGPATTETKTEPSPTPTETVIELHAALAAEATEEAAARG
jgi:hypothetical protein